jgi:hypothetical protein
MKQAIPSATETPKQVDVLIVGTGPVGATFSRMIHTLHPSAKILMADLGPQLTERPGTNVRNIAERSAREQAQLRSQGPTKFPYSITNLDARTSGSDPCADISSLARPGTHLIGEDAAQSGMPAAAASSNVGGMGAHWTCACPRPGDGEAIDALPAEEIDRLYKLAESLLGVTATAFEPTVGGASIEAKLTSLFDSRLGGRKVQAMPLACSIDADNRLVWAGADTILGPLADVDNSAIELWSETLCRRLLLDGDRVTGAEIEHLPSHTKTCVLAKFVVVAADALRTPQLLFASGIRPKALGHYLNDQPQVVSVVRIASPETRTASEIDGVYPAPFDVFWVPYSSPGHPFHGQVMHTGSSPIRLAATEDNEAAASFLTLGWFCAKDVRFEDHIEFSLNSRDYLGMPALSIHYGLSEIDERNIAHSVDAVCEAVARLGEAVEGYDPRMIPAGSSLHYQGSTRMGEGPEDSVCDSFSRVWSIHNLYLGGNGVIPTATACNPTLTSCALAIRAAEQIASRLKV